MEKFKKIFREVNHFTFDVLIATILIWKMYLSITLIIEVPIIGIPILTIGVFVAILMRKKKI